MIVAQRGRRRWPPAKQPHEPGAIVQDVVRYKSERNPAAIVLGILERIIVRLGKIVFRDGIARYRGMQILDKNGQNEEHLILEFREGKLSQREIVIEGTLDKYFAFVEAVTDEFDRHIDARK